MKTRYLYLFFLLMISPISSWSTEESESATENVSGIPPVAHFVYGIWDTAPMSSYFEENMRLWKEQGWEVKLWSKSEIEQLLSLPENQKYKQVYYELSRNIQKADYIRYLILFREGGFYFDLDCEPRNSLFNYMSPLFQNSKDVFFVETVTSDDFGRQVAAENPIRRGVPETPIRIANFAFGAHKNSPIFEQILDLAAFRCAENPDITDDYGVIYTTGPDCVTEVVTPLFKIKEVHLITNHSQFMHHQCTSTWRWARDR